MKGTKSKKSGGFSIIELLVSMMVILSSLLLASRIVFYGLNNAKKSSLRTRLVQRLEENKNKLMAVPFDSPQLMSGQVVKGEGGFQITRNVELVSMGLKRITLSVSYKNLRKTLRFYRSRLLGIWAPGISRGWLGNGGVKC